MSKGLEALKRIRQETCPATYNNDFDKNERCDIIEKELQALEIIKEKEVNVFIFLHSGDLETYNDMVEDNRKLNQEEYELLKEVLLWVRTKF